MTTTTHAARHASVRPARRDSLRDWLDSDHDVPGAVLVSASLAALAGLFLVGYALLFLG